MSLMTTMDANDQDFDAMIWGIVSEPVDDGIQISCIKQSFRIDNDCEPTDLGYKYYILTVGEKGATELVKAIIGDPQQYIIGLAKLGYRGMMIKQESVSKSSAKKLLKTALSSFGIKDSMIKATLKQV